MTREEAIEGIEVLRNIRNFDAPGLKEALDMAVSALSAQPAKLDRSRWEGCEYCKQNVGVGYKVKPCGNGDLDARAQYVFDGIPGVVLYVNRHTASGYFDIAYCPICGKPLTEKAWAEQERRIGGSDGP